MTAAQKHEATIASIKASVDFWTLRKMTIPAARASALLQRVEAGGDQ